MSVDTGLPAKPCPWLSERYERSIVRSELQSLLDSALRIGDLELAQAIAPDANLQLGSLAPMLLSDEVPAGLLGLAARRGHVALVDRLVKLCPKNAGLACEETARLTQQQRVWGASLGSV